MHDLMSDLSVEVAREEITLLNSEAEYVNVKERTLHLSINPEVLSRRRIRVLDLSNLSIERVPPSIDKLKHIRYLDLSQNKGIKVLPNSITNLQNLQTLVLIECGRLKQLPKHMKKLVNLRHLYIRDCPSLTHMPYGLGQLTSLQNLSMFVVAKDNRISKQSGGFDELSEFEAAKLEEKQHLQNLHLAWKLGAPYDKSESNTNDDNGEISLEELQPHRNLKWLVISGCGKVKFPSWISTLEFDRIRIHREWQSNVRIYHGGTLAHKLPKSQGMAQASVTPIPLPTYLDIMSCPNLTSMPLIPSVKSLVLRNTSMRSLEDTLKMKISVLQYRSSCPSSSSSSSSTSPIPSQLKSLCIHEIEGLEFLAEELMQNLTSLRQLHIADCPTITTLPCAIQHLTSLKALLICGCEKLDFLADKNENGMQWQCLRSLKRVQFKNMAKLVSLPKGLQHVTTLRKLGIESCPNLMSLPKWMTNLTRLQYLELDKCPNLSERCSKNMGADWPMIAHIPNIKIDGRWIQLDGHYKT
ncbi:putative disease resistance protein RGA1 [Jatropha curcas]|uniref:putative disease resistance protein RGA1 n=1 Tax=Jatropha curcas TaxID=180498 RepID=UPI0018948D57|nr:putative disease resistance protein RGA1 [Jatropha curcas]